VSEEATAAVAAATPPPAFENFLSDSIGASLKENPKMPSLNKDVPPGQESSVPEQPAEHAEKTKPETSPLLPDFSKLAFGQPIEKATEAERKADLTSKKEVVPPEEFPEKFPGSATAQAQETWAKMRTNVQTLYKQNSELTAKIKEHEEKLKEFDGKTPMASDEYERLTGERDTLVKELRLVKLEATPEYQKAVAKPLGVVEAEIKRLGTKYSISQSQIRSALTESDRDKQGDLLSKVTDTFNDRDKLTLFKLADDSKEILRRRSVLQQDVKQALEYIETKRAADQERTQTERKTEWNGAQKKAWKTISDTLYLARPLDGNDEWNAGLEQTKALVASTDLDALEPVDRAKVLVQAALLPRAMAAINQLWGMYQQANGALKRYQGVTPGAGGGSSSGGETANGAAESKEDGMSFIDAIESKIRGSR
jgi:hypothetical protein